MKKAQILSLISRFYMVEGKVLLHTHIQTKEGKK